MSVLLYVTSAVDDGFGPLLEAVEAVADGAFLLLVTRSAPADTKPHELRDWLTLPADAPSDVGRTLLRLYAEQMRPALAVFAGADAPEMLDAAKPWVGATVLVQPGSRNEEARSGSACAHWIVDGAKGLAAHRDALRGRVPVQWVLERGAPLGELIERLAAAQDARDVELFWRGPVSSELEQGIEAALRSGGRVRVQLGLRDGILGAPRRSLSLLREVLGRSHERLDVQVVAEDGAAVPAARLVSRGLGGLQDFVEQVLTRRRVG